MKIKKHDFPLIAAFAGFVFAMMVIGTGEFFAAMDRTQIDYENQIERIDQ